MKLPRLFLPLALVAAFACREAPVMPQASAPAPSASDASPSATRPASCPALSPEQVSRFVRLSLACVDREYPNKPGHVFDGDETVVPPRHATPAFAGCFDWHSAVHGHWAMVRALKVFPNLPERDAILSLLDTHLSRERLDRELAFFALKRSATFERPYGWGWLLRLAAELHGMELSQAAAWRVNLRLLADHFSGAFQSYLARLSRPVREGTHANTAFSMVHALDYARTVGDEALEKAIVEAALRFYRSDVDCPVAYEPSGEDFISPCLAEADLMRRVLPPDELMPWLAVFLPGLSTGKLGPVGIPPEIRDVKDPKLGHLVGLSFQRAWALRGLADVWPADSAEHSVIAGLSAAMCGHGSSLVFDSGYGGEHWLASFAIYLLTGCGDPAPGSL